MEYPGKKQPHEERGSSGTALLFSKALRGPSRLSLQSTRADEINRYSGIFCEFGDVIGSDWSDWEARQLIDGQRRSSFQFGSVSCRIGFG